MKRLVYIFFLSALISCSQKGERVKPVIQDITESVYASGVVKSRQQYQAFPTVSGIISDIFVKEGDSVLKGTPIMMVFNETSRLSKENAELAASYADYGSNAGKLKELKINIELAKSKMQNDSVLLSRQRALFSQQVGTKTELEQRELAFQNSKTNYMAAMLRYDDLNKQLLFASNQAKTNLNISKKLENDFVIKSEIDGRVYAILKEKGEMVSPQTPVAVVGAASDFLLELQVDEYDIVNIKEGQQVLISMDSYKGKSFEARVTKINPIMNERTKTFQVEASFIVAPEVLYPNLTVEANIIIQTKSKALTIPRSFVSGEGYVKTTKGDSIKVETGLKDFRIIEIVSGIQAETELVKP